MVVSSSLFKASVSVAVNRCHATLKFLIQTLLFNLYRIVVSDHLTSNNSKPFDQSIHHKEKP